MSNRKDAKGCQASSANATAEMTDEQREAICYKSKLLNKYFDSYDKLIQEEDAYKKAHEAELQIKEARTKEALEVENAAKAYLEVVEQNKKLRAEMAQKEQAFYDQYKEKLCEFSKNHKGYHLTYTYDGKNIEFKVEENRQNSLQEYIDSQNKLMRKFFDNFWF